MLHTLQHNKVSFPGVMNHEKKMLNKKSLHREFCHVGGFLFFWNTSKLKEGELL